MLTHFQLPVFADPFLSERFFQAFAVFYSSNFCNSKSVSLFLLVFFPSQYVWKKGRSFLVIVFAVVNLKEKLKPSTVSH